MSCCKVPLTPLMRVCLFVCVCISVCLCDICVHTCSKNASRIIQGPTQLYRSRCQLICSWLSIVCWFKHWNSYLENFDDLRVFVVGDFSGHGVHLLFWEHLLGSSWKLTCTLNMHPEVHVQEGKNLICTPWQGVRTQVASRQIYCSFWSYMGRTERKCRFRPILVFKEWQRNFPLNVNKLQVCFGLEKGKLLRKLKFINSL